VHPKSGSIADNFRTKKIAQEDERSDAEKKMETLLVLLVLKRNSPAVNSHQ
jgi:hypothetical protein